ncbi:preprotein translocase subunit SecG [Candidatus Woesebacteria bacterium]|nr:preprotein translocase subunit SecG [Candidatus Woesebacteria bacterium]
MQTTFFILQMVVSVLLLGGILLQPNGSGLGSSWGGGGESYHTRRGLEKVVFISTIVAAVLFTIVSIVLLLKTNS